jgi:hypothetical protein
MTGYDVVSSDDHTIGTVVADHGDYLVIEHGLLRKARHLLPKVFAHPVDAERIVRLTISKDIVADSPKLEDDSIDEEAVARHYGLAAGETQPSTEGRGDLLPDDPAEAAEVEGARHGIEPAAKQRAEIREGRHDADAPLVRDRTPHAFDPSGTTANRH